VGEGPEESLRLVGDQPQWTSGEHGVQWRCQEHD
jgi:hypothetical protein